MNETTLTETADPARVRRIEETAGVWVVETETSRYLLDLDRLTSTRLPGRGAGPVAGLPAPETTQLRRDEEPVPIVGIVLVEVGAPMVLQLGIRDGFVTHRRTTVVRAITRCA